MSGEAVSTSSPPFSSTDCEVITIHMYQTVPDVRLRGISARCSPRAQLQFHRPDGGATVSTHWTPDTGVETSAVFMNDATEVEQQASRR